MKMITGSDVQPSGEIKSSKSSLFTNMTPRCLVCRDKPQSNKRSDENIYFLVPKTLLQNKNL